MLISQLGEEALIEGLRDLFAATTEGVPVGIGDDAAVINGTDRQMVWTTDLLVEGVHFQRGWQTPGELGRKCLAVNLSDVAAMGAVPRYALFSIACPSDTDVDMIMEVSRGFCDLALQEQVAVIGGDTTSSPGPLVLSVTAGGIASAAAPLLRSGARSGDTILVSGYLGSAAGGLKLLIEGGAGRYQSLVEAFISPKTTSGVAQDALGAGATAMTDVSDGLASDLRHVCVQSGVGAAIDRGRLPVDPLLIEACQEYGWDADELVLAGGEDYVLLFTLPREIAAGAAAVISKKNDMPITDIGEMTSQTGIVLKCEPERECRLPDHGYDHFLKHG